jgi:hypothetical protein
MPNNIKRRLDRLEEKVPESGPNVRVVFRSHELAELVIDPPLRQNEHLVIVKFRQPRD